jgi:hypothetical protein
MDYYLLGKLPGVELLQEIVVKPNESPAPVDPSANAPVKEHYD